MTREKTTMKNRAVNIWMRMKILTTTVTNRMARTPELAQFIMIVLMLVYVACSNLTH